MTSFCTDISVILSLLCTDLGLCICGECFVSHISNGAKSLQFTNRGFIKDKVQNEF